MNDPHEWDGWEGRDARSKAIEAERKIQALAEQLAFVEGALRCLHGSDYDEAKRAIELTYRAANPDGHPQSLRKGR